MGKNYGIGSILTIKTRPITKEYDAGYTSTFHRRCRQCRALIDMYPPEAQWCQMCRGYPMPGDELIAHIEDRKEDCPQITEQLLALKEEGKVVDGSDVITADDAKEFVEVLTEMAIRKNLREQFIDEVLSIPSQNT